MSKTKFKELLEEYISNLEKDYDSNQTGNSNHPVFSVIQNTSSVWKNTREIQTKESPKNLQARSLKVEREH